MCPHTPPAPRTGSPPERSRAMAEFGINQSGHQKWGTGFHAPPTPKKEKKKKIPSMPPSPGAVPPARELLGRAGQRGRSGARSGGGARREPVMKETEGSERRSQRPRREGKGRQGRKGSGFSYLLRAGALAASSSACWAPAGAGGGGQPGRGGGKSCLSPRDPVSCSSLGARAGSGIYFLLLCIHDAE